MKDPDALRMTTQRQVILDELCKLKTHPTADDLYQIVRKQLPKISLGTVYRNLELLSEQCVIQKLDVGGTQKRFDGNAGNHYHVRCEKCNRVNDVELDPITDIEEKARKITQFKILRHRLEFIGTCPACHSRSAASLAAPVSSQKKRGRKK